MNNDFYEDIYTENIEPLYGKKRIDVDDVLLLKNNKRFLTFEIVLL